MGTCCIADLDTFNLCAMAKTVQAAEDRICSNGGSDKQDIKSIFGFNLCSRTSQPPVRATPVSHSGYWTGADLAETAEQVNCNRLCWQFYYISCTACSTRVSSQMKTLQISSTSYWYSICFIFPQKVAEIWPSVSFKKTNFLYRVFHSYLSKMEPLLLSRTSISLSPRHQLMLRSMCRREVTVGPT